MIGLIKKHYLVIILALVVGGLTCFPQILAIKNVKNFQGVYKIDSNDENYYLARAKDVIDGHIFLSNPYLYEHKDGYPVEVWLPDYVLAKPLAIFHVDLRQGYLFYDFLLPFILVLLSYAIMHSLTGSVFLSFLGAAFLHLNLFLFNFGRNPSPQLNFIFWLLLYLIWLKFLKQPNLFYTIILGLVFGLLFHIYTYYWTFYVVFLAIFLFLNFILKRPCPYKKYFLAFALALIIAIPYFIFLFKGMGLPYYAETLARIGMINTHFPAGRKIVMWGGIILFLFYISYKKRILSIGSRPILLLAGVLASIVAVNQQIITGKNMQFASHYWMPSIFCFVFVFIYLLNLWLPKIKFRYLKISILSLLIIYVFYSPAIYAKALVKGEVATYSQAEIDEQRYAPLFFWLNRNTAADEVVFADEEISNLIPIYTANNVFYFGMSALFFMPDKEAQTRFIISHYWEEFNRNFAVNNKFGMRGAYYQTNYDNNLIKNKVRKLFFQPLENYELVPQAEIDNFLKLAQEVKSKNFISRLKQYKVDYFIWDKAKDKNWPVENLNFLEPVYKVNDMVIYKIK